MKKKILLMVLSVFLLCSMSVMLGNAQTGTVGVNAGDWYKWDWNYDWSSDNESETMPSGMDFMMLMDWTNLSIIDVTGSIVTYTGTVHLKNGTEQTVEQPVTYDVNNRTDLSNLFFISPNLGANDIAFSAGGEVVGDLMINETVSRTYPSGTRETNHISFTNETTTNGKTEITSFDSYWDRSTGVMVEMVVNVTTYEGGYTTTVNMGMILDESNVWVVPEFPTWIPIVIASIALVTVITLYKRKLARITTIRH